MPKKIWRPKDIKKDEILCGYYYQGELIESIGNEIEKLMADVNKMTSTITDMPFGGDGADMGDKIIKYLPLVDEMNEEIVTAVTKRRKILSYLDTVKNPKLRTVLQLNYVECLEQEEIAERMHYSSTQWIRELINIYIPIW